MNKTSIFEDVVRSEDSHTNLLRNLVNIDDAYAKAVFNSLLPSGLEKFAGEPFVLRTQVSLNSGTNGRADILIESLSVVLLVEVKTSPHCPLTINQELIDENRGYLAYLLERKTPQNEVGITFLAPSSWKQAAVVRSKLQQLRIQLPTKFLSWEDLVTHTGRHPLTPFACEFNKLLEHSLEMISFNDDEKKLFERQGPAFSSASRKLHGLVWQTRKQIMTELASRNIFGFKTEWADDVRESGYVLYFGKDQVLWIGVWDISPFPLVAAVKNDWKLASSSASALDSLGLQLDTSDDWRLYSLTDALLSPDPLSSVTTIITRTAEAVHDLQQE